MRGILINNELHTGNDLNMVMTSKDIAPPALQTYVIDVPGRNGTIDLSEFLTGEIAYKNRTLKFTFIGDGSRETVLSLIDTMLNYHGKYITITTDDYPSWYYTGRATVAYSDKGYLVEFTLTVDAQPFRYGITPKTVEYTGPITRTITIVNHGKPVVPTITVITSTLIVKGDTTYTLKYGTYELNDLILSTGNNELTITSDKTVTITFQERAI